MCLAVPGKVVEIFETNGIQMGKMDFDGITKNICLAYIPDIQVGEYAIVHVGFAIEKLDEKSALETLEVFRNMGFLEEELGLSEVETVQLTYRGANNEISSRIPRPGTGKQHPIGDSRRDDATVGDYGSLRRSDAFDYPARH